MEGVTTIRDRRREVRGFTDAALLTAMRADDPAAWSEFLGRFSPLLDRYARIIGVPAWYRRELVSEVLDDEALRLSSKQQTPRNLSWYLCSALHHRLIRAKRGAARRERAHQASTESLQEGATTSEYAIQSIANPLSVKEGLGESALSRLATLISKKLSADERQLLIFRRAQFVA
jgi:DNA-directed RNA polymerase specialized sigma24 family protein